MPMAIGFAGAFLAVCLAAVVLRVGRGTAQSRILASLLVFEAINQGAYATGGLGPEQTLWEEAWVAVALWATAVLGLLYLLFLSFLDSPLVSWLRRRAVRLALIVALAIVPTLALVATAAFLDRPDYTPGSTNLALLPLVVFGVMSFIATCVYAFVVAISVLRRAPPGPRRQQARAYVAAFGARDLLYLLGLGSNLFAGVIAPGIGVGKSEFLQVSGTAGSLATLIFVPLLAYGLLKTQLFDIDLKIKLGISRSTVVAIILVAVFVLAKVVENYLNRTAGFVAGSIVAGLLLFLVPKLNKVGEKVANAAMPQVQPTPVYVQFKKLEVYRVAVESAQETGGIGPRERSSLDRMRDKLGLVPADCTAVEADVQSARPTTGTPVALG